MSVPPHLTVLRTLVAGDAAAAARALGEPGFNGAGFLAFARQHQLGAYCYSVLRRLGLTRALPPALSAAAKATALLERSLAERLARELGSLGELLERARAQALFIKGPLLAERYYGTVASRSVSDLDILVPSGQELARIEALLLAAGYSPAYGVPLSRSVGRYFAHHFEYRKDDLPLDVHWALQRHFSFAIDYHRVWATATTATLDGRHFPTTSDEYELVLQVLGVLTDLQVGKLTLRPLVDIRHILAVLERTTDWDAFLAQRRQERILRPTAYVLGLTMEVLECQGAFPALTERLAPLLRDLPLGSSARAAVLSSRPLDLGQKLLALRIYEAPLAASAAWWLVSLPFRMLHYGVTRPLLPH